MDLREATTITVTLGPFVDKTDGFTAKTALSPTVKLAKNGGTLTARNSATAITHDADGYYKVEFNATDTGTRGRLLATVTDATNHLPVWADFDVVSKEHWDEKYAAEVVLQTATNTTATLDSGASAVDNYYNNQLLVITSGTGAGQVRRITAYTGSTKVATVSSAWATNPVAGSTFRIISDDSIGLTEQNAIADALLDRANGIATGLTPRSALKVSAAACGGKLSGSTGAAGTIKLRNAVADSKDVITATVDSNGNRTAIVYDLS